MRRRRLPRALIRRGLAPEFDPRQQTPPKARLRKSRATSRAGAPAKGANHAVHRAVPSASGTSR